MNEHLALTVFIRGYYFLCSMMTRSMPARSFSISGFVVCAGCFCHCDQCLRLADAHFHDQRSALSSRKPELRRMIRSWNSVPSGPAISAISGSKSLTSGWSDARSPDRNIRRISRYDIDLSAAGPALPAARTGLLPGTGCCPVTPCFRAFSLATASAALGTVRGKIRERRQLRWQG